MGNFQKIPYQQFIEARNTNRVYVKYSLWAGGLAALVVLTTALFLDHKDIIKDSALFWVLIAPTLCLCIPIFTVDRFLIKPSCPHCNSKLVTTNQTNIPILQFGKCPHCFESIFEDFPPPPQPTQPQGESTPSIFPIPLETYQAQVDEYQKAYKADFYYILTIFILPAIIACAVLGFTLQTVFDSPPAWPLPHTLLLFALILAIILILCKYLSSLYRQISARRFPPPLPCPNCAFDTLAYPTLVSKTASCPRCAHQLIVES